MTEALAFDFGAEPADVRTVGPTGETLPIAGRTPESRDASASGARQAVKTWGVKVSEYLQILANGGPISDHAAAALMKCGLSSICSIRNGLIDRAEERGEPAPIVPDGFDLETWADGGTTKRTKWRLRR